MVETVMVEKHKLDAMETKCLRSMCGVTRMDRWMNEEVRCRVGVTKITSERVDGTVLKYFRLLLFL